LFQNNKNFPHAKKIKKKPKQQGCRVF